MLPSSDRFRRRGSALVLLALAAFVLFVPVRVSASGYYIPEMDAEAMGQAVAFAARTDGASSIFFNAAGLADIEGWDLTVGTTPVWPNTKVTGPDPIPLQTDLEDKTYFPTHVYFGHSLGSFAYGVGFTTPFGLGFEYPQGWPLGLNFGSYVVERVTLQTKYLSPSVAYKFGDHVSVGLGIDWIVADVELENQQDLSALAAGLGLSSLAPLQMTLTGDNGSGTASWNVGLKVKAGKFLAGLAYRHGATLTLEGDVDFTTPTTGNAQIDGLLASLFPDQAGKTELPIPAVATLGLAYMATEKFGIELDVNRMNWSDFDSLTVDFSQETTLPGTPVPVLQDRSIERNWKDGYTYRLGANIDATDDLSVRFGLLYDPTVVPDETLDPILPESDRKAFSIGGGFKGELADVDVAYMNLRGETRKTTTNQIGFNATYETQAHLLSFTFKFHGAR